MAHFRTGEGTTGVEDDIAPVADLQGARIESLSPNPSPGATRIVFVTPQGGFSEALNGSPAPRITVHDAAGRRVTTLSNDRWSRTGQHVVLWPKVVDVMAHRALLRGELATGVASHAFGTDGRPPAVSLTLSSTSPTADGSAKGVEREKRLPTT